MKLISFSRKAILRAIHAAALALYLAAIATAHAQTATGDGHGNVTITGNGPTPFSLGPTSTPPLAASGTLTIGNSMGGGIQVTGSSGSAIYSVQVDVPVTISSGANLRATNTNSSGGSAADDINVAPITASGNVTIDNTTMGSISAYSDAGNATAINVQNVEHGSISITNSNYVGAQAYFNNPAETASGIYAKDSYAQGSISLTNSGIMEVNDTYFNGYGAQLTTSGSGGITVTNSGGIHLTILDGGGTIAAGLDLTSTGSGPIMVTNSTSGSITASSIYAEGIGIDATASGSGAVTITNSGYVKGSNTTESNQGIGVNVSGSGSGAVTVSNTGTLNGTCVLLSGNGTGLAVNESGSSPVTITNSAYITALASGGTASGVYVNNAGTGNVSITNAATGTISPSSNTGVANGIDAIGSGSGTLSISNAGNLAATAGNGFANGIDATTANGALSITNTGTITGSAYLKEAGIQATSTGSGAVSITNSGSVTGTNTNLTTAVAYGLLVNASGSGAVNVSNTAPVAESGGTASGIYVGEGGTGSVTIANSASGTITASSNSSLFSSGIEVKGFDSNVVSISNAAALTINSSATSSGIYVNTAAGSTSITNSGALSIPTGQVSSGISAIGAGNISITNNAGGTISAVGGTSCAGFVANSSAGTTQVTNAAAITSNSAGYVGGIVATGTAVTVTNSGAISAATVNLFISNGPSYGILTSASSGPLTVTNSATINASGYNASGISASSTGTGSITITNSAAAAITASASYEVANAIVVSGSNSNVVTISNSAALSASAPSTAAGIYANMAAGSTTITNSGAITLSGAGAGNGIAVQSAGDITITNSAGGTISAPNVGGPTAIEAVSSGGTVQITNAAAVTAGAANGQGEGIDASGTSASITNSGAISISAAGNGNAYAIFAGSTSGPLTIRNSGPLTATASGAYDSYGICLQNAGTVIDSGNITAGTYAIQAQDGSSVTLKGRPVISGTIQGNSSSTTTSQLIFAQSVPSANLAAAKTQLNTEIAAYAAQNGGDYTFTFDGLTYDVSNFEYDGGVIDDLTALITRLYRNTPGFYSEGLVLDTLPTGNAVAARLLAALNNLPNAGLAHALSELSPKELEAFRNVAFDNNTFSAQQVKNHLANLRDGLTGFDSSALTVRDSHMDPTLNQVRDHLLAYNPSATPGLMSDTIDSLFTFDAKDMKSAQVNTMPVDRWSTFIAGDVILADRSDNPNLQDSNYTTGSVSAGLDYRLDEHFTVGALFAYAHTDADLDQRNSSATVDSYSPGIYASYVNKGWYGNFLGAYTRNAYTEDRAIDITGLNGDNHGATSGNQGSANLTGGYEFQRGAFKFGPVASLQYVHLAIDSIQEQGPTALDINRQNQDSLRSLLGFEGRFNANVATPIGPVSLTPHVSASWQHEYLDNGGGITSQFEGAGGGSFSTQTDTPDRDSAFVDAGLDATVSKNVTVFVDYEAQAGQSNFFAQSAQGGVKIGF